IELTTQYRYDGIPAVYMDEICERFTSLTSIGFRDFENVSMNQVVLKLTRVPHLVHLYLDLKFPDFIEDHSPATVQLPSIKSLCFYLAISSHDNFATLNLDWIFPNVQIVNICISNCREDVCSICDIEDFFEEDDKKWQEK